MADCEDGCLLMDTVQACSLGKFSEEPAACTFHPTYAGSRFRQDSILHDRKRLLK